MKKVLIVNRGEIAVRIIRACQELELKTVAVHSLADSNSLHVKIADESVCIGDNKVSESYLNIPSILSTAEITGADAIHPGYGFLSENYEFAKLCNQYDLIFIGPKAEHIKLMGNKIRAREFVKKESIPLLSGSNKTALNSETAKSVATKLGYPIIIKAAAGGGGRGMRIVENPDDFDRYFHLAQSEGKNFFGDSSVYIEKFLTQPRHIEVQIIADKYGNIATLGERECSLQRRYQKVLEEAPCAFLTPKERETVFGYAYKLAKSVDYESVGTIEFLYENGEFYFMEMNTRIQVEHPVTEMTTNIDLVKEQIKISQGQKLDFSQPKLSGHSIECRINAEDPFDFSPSPGTITDYHPPGGPGIRVDSMIYRGCSIPPYYDSLLAKLISYGRDRKEAIQRMKRALAEFKVKGIKTNIKFFQEILDDRSFKNGEISTGYLQKFLDKRIEQFDTSKISIPKETL